MIRKKLYLIILINLRSKTLAMLSIKVTTKYDDMTYQIKLGDRFRGKKKARSKDIT